MPTVIDDADIIAVCNQSLGLLGAELITINGTDQNHDLCTLYYPDAKDEMLICHPWNHAYKRANMLQAATPLNEYDYAFTKPTDCLRVLRIDNDPLCQFRVEGSLVLTNSYESPDEYDDDSVDYLAGQYVSYSDVTYLVDTSFTSSDWATDLAAYLTTQTDDLKYVPVEYIYQAADIENFPAYLKQCVVYNLAIKLAPPIKASEKAAMNLQQMLYGGPQVTGYLNMARSLDAQESAVTEIKTQSWINSRY